MHVVHELNTSHLNFQMCKCEQIGLLEKLTQRREKKQQNWNYSDENSFQSNCYLCE